MVPRKVMCFTQCHAGMIISESFQIVLFALRFSNYTTLIHTHTHTYLTLLCVWIICKHTYSHTDAMLVCPPFLHILQYSLSDSHTHANTLYYRVGFLYTRTHTYITLPHLMLTHLMHVYQSHGSEHRLTHIRIMLLCVIHTHTLCYQVCDLYSHLHTGYIHIYTKILNSKAWLYSK